LIKTVNDIKTARIHMVNRHRYRIDIAKNISTGAEKIGKPIIMYGAIQLSRLEKNVCAFFRLKTAPRVGVYNPME